MAWSDKPEIKALAPYCEKFKYEYIVTFAVHKGRKNYTITTYGRDGKLCKVAAIAGEALKKLIDSGKWPTWPDKEPEESPDPMIKWKER